jgi:hypothetical protein
VSNFSRRTAYGITLELDNGRFAHLPSSVIDGRLGWFLVTEDEYPGMQITISDLITLAPSAQHELIRLSTEALEIASKPTKELLVDEATEPDLPKELREQAAHDHQATSAAVSLLQDEIFAASLDDV